MVDPIPSFLNKLRTHEKQCRKGGYLTAVDDDDIQVNDDVAKDLAGNVADMSASCRRHVVMSADYAKKCVSARHNRGHDTPWHTQFVSIKADKFKSAQTYGYCTYHTFFVFELKKKSRYCKH